MRHRAHEMDGRTANQLLCDHVKYVPMKFVRPLCLLLLVVVFFMSWDATTKFIVSMICGIPFVWDFVASFAKRKSSEKNP
jgi:hypothetical protein